MQSRDETSDENPGEEEGTRSHLFYTTQLDERFGDGAGKNALPRSGKESAEEERRPLIMKEKPMNRPFTLISLALTATLAFFLGALVAGPLTTAPVASASTVQAPKPVAPTRASMSSTAIPTMVVNFADVVGRVNAAVVNIDATSRGGRRMPS